MCLGNGYCDIKGADDKYKGIGSSLQSVVFAYVFFYVAAFIALGQVLITYIYM